MLGYVWTGYANNAAGNPVQPWMTPAPLSAVENEAMEWYSWYRVNDFFFDGATTGTTNGQLSYHQNLYNFIHCYIPGSQVWINPGWYPSSSAYMSAADVIMDFESSYSTLTTNPPPSWVYSYPASRFANVRQLPDSQASSLSAALSLTQVRSLIRPTGNSRTGMYQACFPALFWSGATPAGRWLPWAAARRGSTDEVGGPPMGADVMFLDCPAYLDQHGTVRCGLPAQVEYCYSIESTDGPLESARIRCPAGHVFNGPVESLTPVNDRAAAPSREAVASTA